MAQMHDMCCCMCCGMLGGVHSLYESHLGEDLWLRKAQMRVRVLNSTGNNNENKGT